MVNYRIRRVVHSACTARNYALALVLASLLVPVTPWPASGDRVYLKSGVDFEVDRWWEEGDTIRYERFGGVIAVPKQDVERIEKEAPADVKRPQVDVKTPTQGARRSRIYLRNEPPFAKGEVIEVDRWWEENDQIVWQRIEGPSGGSAGSVPKSLVLRIEGAATGPPEYPLGCSNTTITQADIREHEDSLRTLPEMAKLLGLPAAEVRAAESRARACIALRKQAFGGSRVSPETMRRACCQTPPR